jgi:hypothetical protein
MDTRRVLRVLALYGASVLLGGAQTFSINNQLEDIAQWSEAHQTAWINWYLDQGMPPPTGTLGVLVHQRSDLAVPLLEKKIEEVLHAKSPADCFSDKAADPNRFVFGAASIIASSADRQGMKAIDKLMRINEERFGGFVTDALSAAYGRENPVKVAYEGLDLGNPGMDRRIVEWIAPLLYDKKSPTAAAQLKQWWADAILDRYSVVPKR